MRYLSFPAEVRVTDIDKGEIEGYASVFDVINSYREVFHEGAFKKTISEDRGRIKVLYMHTQPFGMPVKMKEDEYGLYTLSKVVPTQENKDRMEYIKAGVVDGLSIGFDYVANKNESDDEGIVHIYEAKLWEYSPVIWGADPLAKIDKVRSIKKLSRHLQRVIDGHCANDSDLIMSALDEIKALVNSGKPEASTSLCTKPPKQDDTTAELASLCQEIGSIAEAERMKKELDAFANSLRR